MTQNNKLLWWQKAVVYQIYPRSFKDSTGNGIGDLQGVIDNLDYLNDGTENSLGIDAIWFSPIFPSPMADHGYDVADYCDINELFGDLETFDRLVAAAHKRDIKIIIDYVPNHSSDLHPWFIESRSSRDNPKADWYIWRDAKPDGSRPNNWGSCFGGPAWDWDETRQQYYMHQFVKEQPDLNWRNPQLREAMLDVLRFWMERGVDGFRMDVIGMLVKHPDLADNPPNPDADPDLPANAIFQRQLNINNHDVDGIHDVIREIRSVLDEYNDRCGIGEIWGELPRWVKYYGENGDGLQMPFNFGLINLPWKASEFRALVDSMEEVLPSFAWPNYVLGNHDVPRIASRFGAEQARICVMMLLTLRGTPTLYNGDELGMENGVIPMDKVQDPQGINFGAETTRDVCRTPVQWDDSDNAGFSTAEPWLPVSADYKTRNVIAQNDDPTSMLNLNRRLLWYRKQSPILQGGSYRPLDTNEDCFVYLRTHDTGSCLIALNFSDKQQKLKIADTGTGKIVISTHLDREEDFSGEELTLRPNEGVIIELT